jgi:uncharacterized protein YlxW (UPF0749 family)
MYDPCWYIVFAFIFVVLPCAFGYSLRLEKWRIDLYKNQQKLKKELRQIEIEDDKEDKEIEDLKKRDQYLQAKIEELEKRLNKK